MSTRLRDDVMLITLLSWVCWTCSYENLSIEVRRSREIWVSLFEVSLLRRRSRLWAWCRCPIRTHFLRTAFMYRLLVNSSVEVVAIAGAAMAVFVRVTRIKNLSCKLFHRWFIWTIVSYDIHHVHISSYFEFSYKFSPFRNAWKGN